MTRPAPLTPPDCDLRDFQFMPLDVVRLTQSDLVAFEDPAAVVANMLLWCASWHQVPAASLTNDDRTLARLAGYGRGGSEWDKVRDGARRGWIECSDGRLYHPVVAEKARESFAKKLAQRHRTYLAAVRKHNERNPQDKRDGLSFDGWIAADRPRDVVNTAPRQGDEPDLLDNVTRDTPPKSRVTQDHVTRDKGGMSRDQDPNVARDKGTKGEGEGRESKGTVKGDYIEQQQHADASKPGADVVTPKVDPFDLTATADRFARLAGVPHTQPGAIAQNVEVIRQWNADGIDLEAILVPVIERFRLDKPDQRVSSLRFFDQSVRAAVASAEVRRTKGGGYVAKPGKAVDPLKVTDADDDRVRQVRAATAAIGDLAKDRIAFGFDGETLIVLARSMYLKTKIRAEHWTAITTAATQAGFPDVEIRSQ